MSQAIPASSTIPLLAALVAALGTGCLDWGSLQRGRCGDGIVGPEEQCDDGNRVSGDGCSETCDMEPQKALCGNGMLDPGEVCDDGNTSNADACLNGCSRATCGDGQVRESVEECEPETPSGDAMCTPACLICGGPGTYYRPGSEHCFSLHTEPASQADARAACQAEGGDLWTITTNAEGTDTISKLKLEGTYWLGLLTSDMGDSWVTGETFKLASFAKGEPKTPALRCVSLVAAAGEGTWQSTDCATKLSFVCERAGPVIFTTTNHAYKVRTAAVRRDEARTRCGALGGALATLETDEERAFVASKVDLRVWVDAMEMAPGSFVWATGTPVDPAEFRAGQPDDTDGSKPCLSLDPGRRLGDERCDALNAFVCEID